MEITGEYELDKIVVINYTIESAPLATEAKVTIRGLKKAARAIKKDTKALFRLLSKMERHGWKIKRQEEISEAKWLEGDYGDNLKLSCSSCGAPFEYRTSFCPDCGAKMH